ncbi:hypothetical protein [Chitiniphilus eburneus]|uniref:hypothetical protein n=1 Tax=Chitiniphilus eburneus TaxID=2571148 RepID=UPI0035D05BA3
MRLSDLITNAETGRLSHTKLWPNVACAVATGMYIYLGATDRLTPDIWLIYLGIVGGYTAAMRWITRPRNDREGQE